MTGLITRRHGANIVTRPPLWVPKMGAHAPVGLLSVYTPPPFDWRTACPPDGQMIGNDQYSNCVPVSRFRVIQAIKARADSHVTQIDQGAVMARYARIGGYPTKDNGEDPNVDMMDWARDPIEAFGSRWPIIWARVDHTSDNDIALALDRTPLPVSMALPKAAADDPDAWSLPWGTGADWTPSIGHETVLIAVEPDGRRVVRTWGMDVVLHQTWWDHAVVQLDAPIPGARPELAWAGLDLDTVLANLDDNRAAA